MALYETLRRKDPLLPTRDRVAVLTATGRTRRGALLLALGVGDALARAMSSRTGRDCEVDAVGTRTHVFASGDYDMPRTDVGRYDAIAITIATTASGSAPVGWQHALRALLATVLPNIPAGTPIVVGVPVVRPDPGLHPVRAHLVDRRRYRFTNDVATILNTFGRGELVALPLTLDRAAGASGSPDLEPMAGALADRLAPRLLQAGHDAAARRWKLSA